jgi:hypothetical protein
MTEDEKVHHVSSEEERLVSPSSDQAQQRDLRHGQPKQEQRLEKEEELVSPSSNQAQQQEPEYGEIRQEQRSRVVDATKPAVPALPKDLPRKYADLAARDRAFYDGIMKLFSLGLDGDLLYEAMETLWIRYNRKPAEKDSQEDKKEKRKREVT